MQKQLFPNQFRGWADTGCSSPVSYRAPRPLSATVGLAVAAAKKKNFVLYIASRAEDPGNQNLDEEPNIWVPFDRAIQPRSQICFKVVAASFFVQIKLFVVVVIIVLNLNLTNETK